MLYFCCDQRRRDAVAVSSLNGIDYLEVLDSDAPNPADRQLILQVHLIKPLGSESLTSDNFRIEGGERIPNIQVTEVTTAPDSEIVEVRVNQWGDFSTYTLRIIVGGADLAPLSWMDPILSAINFSFKVECPSEFDCETERICPTEPTLQPEINYLAKDYASFRQLMIDRLSALMPQGFERNPASIDMVLVELMAYVGDYLSYGQDAVATEAYLSTARRRTSVRRHARLMDYFMHDGCNARVWVQVQVDADNVELQQGTQLFTRIDGQPVVIPSDSRVYDLALIQRPIIFETLETITLFSSHNKLFFYTWGSQECCLPKGTTRATLQDHHNLQIGDVLIFEEVLGPNTGQAEDANPDHRWAVRLTQVNPTSDPIGGQFATPPNDNAVNVTEIGWSTDDALPFALCISAITDRDHGEQYIAEVSVALGNIVLADHGATISGEDLGTVPETKLFRVPTVAGDRCDPIPPEPVPPRFRPALDQKPITWAAPYDRAKILEALAVSLQQPAFTSSSLPLSAKAVMQWDIQTVLPSSMTLTSGSGLNSANWGPQRDLLNSGRQSQEFVVETETDGTAYIRFGDDHYGLRPIDGTSFTATYRVGNGIQGNIGANALAHIVLNNGSITQVRNPLPAKGGVEPERLEDVRQFAPYAFRVQERAVTLQDWTEVAERHPEVQRAAATFRWTGSWYTVFITIDRKGGLPIDALFEAEMRAHLERYRLAGYDLEIDAPRLVSLEIEMLVCVKPDYFRSDVKEALLEVFSNRTLPDGRRGVFHPDNWTFGQSVYLSQLYAVAQAVEGVASVQIKIFQRQGTRKFLFKKNAAASVKDELKLERLEIVRLDNDPNYPERGVLRLQMEEGK